MNTEEPLVHEWLSPFAALALAAGILLGSGLDSLLPGIVCTALALGCVLLRHDRRCIWAPVLLFASAGMLLGQQAFHPALPEEGTYTVTGVVSEELVQRDTTQIHTCLSELTLNGQAVSGSAYWSFYQDTIPEGLTPGCRVSFTASLYHPSGATNEGGYDFRSYLLQRGITFGLYGGTDDLVTGSAGFSPAGWIASLRHSLLLRLEQVMGQEAGAYAGTMLLGVKSLVPSDDREAFNALGIGHILSVSGFHVGLLYTVLILLLRRLKVPLRLRPLPVGLVLAFYVALTGGSAPVVRAAILCMLSLGGMCFGRPRFRLRLLCVSAIIQLVISPVQVTSAGFHLSYGAMLGLVLVTPTLERNSPFRNMVNRKLRKRCDKVWSLFAAAVGAQLGVLLPQLYWYQELPVLGLFCNVFIMTLASGLLTVFWVCLLVMYLPVIGPAAGAAAGWLSNAAVSAVRVLGSQSWLLLWTKQADWLTAAGWALVLAAVCCLWLRFTRRHAAMLALGAVLCVLSLIPWPQSQVTYTQLDVDAADAAVLYDRGTVTVIDTGESSTLSGWLHRKRWSVDQLVITHLHKDHAGGIQGLLDDNIPVRRCYLTVDAERAPVDEGMTELLAQLQAAGTEIIRVSRGDVIPTPSGTLTVLWPEAGLERAWQDANDGSMVLQASVLGTTMLLTGDITGTYEGYSAVPSDILKAAHHGSSASTTESFLQKTAPQTILLSCGPETRTAAFAERVGSIPVYSTANQGQLTVTLTEGSYSIATYLK